MEKQKPIPVKELKPEDLKVGVDIRVVTWSEQVYRIHPYYFDDGTCVDPNIIDGFNVYKETDSGEKYVGKVYEITEDELEQFED